MDLQKIWEEILFLVESRTSKQVVDTWFGKTKLVSLEGNRLVLEVPNKFFRDKINEQYRGTLAEIIREVAKRDDMEIEFTFQPQEQKKPAREEKKERREESSASTERKFTFSNFVVGPSNQFAHASAKAVAESPGTVYNPLFIYSGVGLGKTHLMKAIADSILARTPRAKVAYLTSEQFTNELISRIQASRMEEFRQKYRNMDILIIDDIQFIAGKERTQEEFFHTFNALSEAHKQIVLASDRQPKEIPDIEERLRSRFEAGLIADIQHPDLETRIAILKKKAAVWNIRLPDDVAQFLAALMKSNIRELEGGLLKLHAFSSLASSEITLELAKEALKDQLGGREQAVTYEAVQKAVADAFGARASEFKSKRRTKTIVLPRQVAMYLCRTLVANASYPDIGRFFGGKDHSTVIHAEKIVREKMEKDPDLKARVELLIKQIKH